VDALVLVEGLGPPTMSAMDHAQAGPDRMERWIRDLHERRDRPVRPMSSRSEAAARLRELNPRMEEELAVILAEKGTREVPGGFVWAYDPLHRTHSPAPFSVEQYCAFLRRIEVPTLLVEGSESGFRQWVADDRARELKTFEQAMVADAGHMVHQDRPAELAAVVARFLASR
jgi:pimeloyl-ACP methyl ester carboxylesterase